MVTSKKGGKKVSSGKKGYGKKSGGKKKLSVGKKKVSKKMSAIPETRRGSSECVCVA